MTCQHISSWLTSLLSLLIKQLHKYQRKIFRINFTCFLRSIKITAKQIKMRAKQLFCTIHNLKIHLLNLLNFSPSLQHNVHFTPSTSSTEEPYNIYLQCLNEFSVQKHENIHPQISLKQGITFYCWMRNVDISSLINWNAVAKLIIFFINNPLECVTRMLGIVLMRKIRYVFFE